MPFSAFMEAALYDGDGGFFTSGHGAGRATADFITSPEVGALFGTLMARELDRWWERLGAPDPFVVIEAGAGRGVLARDVLRAVPRCSSALRYVLVERGDALRESQRDLLVLEPAEDALGPFRARVDPDAEPESVPAAGPLTSSLAELPAGPLDAVILANELLDNLPCDVVERTSTGWAEVLVGLDAAGHFVDVVVAAPPELDLPFTTVVGTRLPDPRGAVAWVARAASVLRRGAIIVVDYAAPASELARRGQRGWLRTYRGHERGTSPLAAPGSQDITADVPLESIRHAAAGAGLSVLVDTTQAEWLRASGIDAIVEESRAHWHERAHVGDLDALSARSRVTEAAALTDPAGLGAHRVLILTKGL